MEFEAAIKLMHDFYIRAFQEENNQQCDIISTKIWKMVQGYQTRENNKCLTQN